MTKMFFLVLFLALTSAIPRVQAGFEAPVICYYRSSLDSAKGCFKWWRMDEDEKYFPLMRFDPLPDDEGFVHLVRFDCPAMLLKIEGIYKMGEKISSSEWKHVELYRKPLYDLACKPYEPVPYDH